MINEARGATLMVDEAYQLTPPDPGRDFGVEAVETIMNTIEGSSETTDDRPAFIFAGYPAEMDRFMGINPGLERQITHRFVFPNYTPVELAEIYIKKCVQNGFTVDPSIDDVASTIAATFTDIMPQHNAGLAQQLYMASRSEVNARCIDQIISGEMSPSRDVLMHISEADFDQASRSVSGTLKTL